MSMVAPMHTHCTNPPFLSCSSKAGVLLRKPLRGLPLHPRARQSKHLGQSRACRASADVAYLSGVREIPSKYKGVLLDQFGVLHDGKVAYPGAIEAVQHMAERGLKLFILSNSSRRVEGALGKIGKLGFDPDWFAGAMTSGEIAHRKIGEAEGPFWGSLGKKCLHFTWSVRGVVPIAPLDLEIVARPEDADFAFAHGTEAMGRGDANDPVDTSIEEMNELLQRCADKGNVPLVIANPDVVTVSGSGLVPMPGTLARTYAAMGGQVQLTGKPDAIVYEEAMKLLDLPADEVLGVGDSIEHDIQGANSAGVDSIFIVGGIHGKELKDVDLERLQDAPVFQELCREHHAQPSYAMPSLRV